MAVLTATWMVGALWSLWSVRVSGMFTRVPDVLMALVLLLPIPITFLAFRFYFTATKDASCPNWLWYLGNTVGFLPALTLCLAPLVGALLLRYIAR